jgi:hypothetical protein
VKVRSSKEQQRHQLERDMERYLSKGGEIKEIPRGVSGTDPVHGKGHQTVLFNGPRHHRRAQAQTPPSTTHPPPHPQADL